MANTLIGSIQVQPATVRPGEPVLVQVCDLNGRPYADNSGVTITIQGVPAVSRYYQFSTPGDRKFTARAAGIEMPETHLFHTRKRAYFGARRFDRQGGRRVHMHSLSGLIHTDHRAPSLDYNLLLGVALVLTKNIAEAEKAYALACFNVLAHNRDDHAKNFSFLLNQSHQWVFAPAYDLTFSDGPQGEQSTMLMGEGRNPGPDHLRALGKEHGLKKAPGILAKVQSAVARWRHFADEAGVSAKSANEIAAVIGIPKARSASIARKRPLPRRSSKPS